MARKETSAGPIDLDVIVLFYTLIISGRPIISICCFQRDHARVS